MEGDAEGVGCDVGTSMPGPVATISGGDTTSVESTDSLTTGVVDSAATELCAAPAPVNTSPQVRSHAVNFLLIRNNLFSVLSDLAYGMADSTLPNHVCHCCFHF